MVDWISSIVADTNMREKLINGALPVKPVRDTVSDILLNPKKLSPSITVTQAEKKWLLFDTYA